MNIWGYYPTNSYPFYGAERDDANRGGESQPWGIESMLSKSRHGHLSFTGLQRTDGRYRRRPWLLLGQWTLILCSYKTLHIALSVIALFILYWKYVLKHLSFLHRLRLPILASDTWLKSQDSLQSAADLVKRGFSRNVYVLCLQFKSEQRDLIAGKWWSRVSPENHNSRKSVTNALG